MDDNLLFIPPCCVDKKLPKAVMQAPRRALSFYTHGDVLLDKFFHAIGYLADTTPNRTGSNRTFMELKYDFERLIDSQKIRSNRTFMELKSRT